MHCYCYDNDSGNDVGCDFHDDGDYDIDDDDVLGY